MEDIRWKIGVADKANRALLDFIFSGIDISDSVREKIQDVRCELGEVMKELEKLGNIPEGAGRE